MKLLAHAWIAVNARPQGNRKLLILGSILPEIKYYTSGQPFNFEEIHEGGDKVYYYLKDKKPNWADLGLGMLAHSLKAGADKYNFDQNLALLGYKNGRIDEFRNKLRGVLGVSYNTAKTRAHNILQLAVDLGIIRDHPDFVREFNKAIADKITREEIKKILADCFQRSPGAVSKSVDELFGKLKPDYFKSAAGLTDLWAELSREFDPKPDKKGLAKLLKELSREYQGKDKVFLKKCIDWTRKNLLFSQHPLS